MATTKWILDTTHSDIQFKVKHLMISTVTGQFNTFEGSFETEGNDFLTAKAYIKVEINSISTNNEQRDVHLKADDFFDAANFPQLTFESVKIEKTADADYKINGILTMRGISKEVDLTGEVSDLIVDPWGKERMGISVEGKVNRKDFGVSFGLLTETGGVALGNEVKLFVNAQFVKQA